MNFSRPRPRRPSEPALPMINVVFLLLIFFLMSAQIAPPPPFDVTAPQADGPGEVEGEHVLFISSGAVLAYGESRDSDVWSALSTITQPEQTTLLIRADRALEASALARVLTRLSGLGFGNIRLVTAPG